MTTEEKTKWIEQGLRAARRAIIKESRTDGIEERLEAFGLRVAVLAIEDVSIAEVIREVDDSEPT